MKTLTLALVFLTSCATLSKTALPRAGHAVAGVKSFYMAMCLDPELAPSKDKTCEEAKGYINDVIQFYTDVNSALGDSE